ncbi:MAG: hypothetical protein ACRYG2_29425 [Janthinobacterium lividum]
MDDIRPVALPISAAVATDAAPLDDDVEDGVRWIASRYTMSDASARILLSQLARQDGVTEAAAARSLPAAAAAGS